MRKFALSTLVILFSILVFSHEFWLQPTKFLLGVKESTTINVFVGEGFAGEKSDGSKYKVQKLDHFSVAGKEDFTTNLLSTDLSLIKARFETEGNHLIAFNNTNKSISLPAIEFNAYLREEGLDDILEARIQSKDTLKDGKEFYQRCVKTLFQVGKKSDETYKINSGMRLELIPSSNPYMIRSADSLTFTVLFDNKPVNNALLLVWNNLNGKTAVVKYRTNSDGLVRFPIERKGRWMISSVKMIPFQGTGDADWQSFWGSYTFGYY